MRRKLKNFKNKNGHSENGAPRQLLDESILRERRALANTSAPPLWDPQYGGWSNHSRPRDYSISLRRQVIPNPG